MIEIVALISAVVVIAVLAVAISEMKSAAHRSRCSFWDR